MLPGPVIETINPANKPGSRTAPDVLMAPFPTQKGPTTPTPIGSEAELLATFGGRVGYSVGYDSVRTFFHEGGRLAYINRVVGPAPVKASKLLNNASSAPVLKVEALYYGSYANAITVQVVAGSVGGTYVLVIADASGELERSPNLADQAAGVAWGDTSKHVRVSAQAGAGNPAVASATALTGGTDDNTNIVDAQWQAALDAFDRRLGPAQVALFGRTTLAAQQMLLAHCQANSRTPLVDLPDTSDPAALSAAALALRPHAASYIGATFAPWAVTPDGFEVPYSAVEAGLIARLDLATGNPNQPAAGKNGRPRWITGLTHDLGALTEAQRETLNEAGVNIAYDVDLNGSIETYGYRTLADPADELKIQFSNARLDMYVRALARAIADGYTFDQIDAKGLLASRYNGELVAMLAELEKLGAIYGSDDDPGFIVETASPVNTPDTAQAKQLNAVIHVRRSPFSELTRIQIINHLATEEL